jgi:hypothetical protein
MTRMIVMADMKSPLSSEPLGYRIWLWLAARLQLLEVSGQKFSIKGE